jgi:hypothetical protein
VTFGARAWTLIAACALALPQAVAAEDAAAPACKGPPICVKGTARYRIEVAADGSLTRVRLLAVSPAQALQTWAQCIAQRWPQTAFADRTPTTPGGHVVSIRLETEACASPTP